MTRYGLGVPIVAVALICTYTLLLPTSAHAQVQNNFIQGGGGITAPAIPSNAAPAPVPTYGSSGVILGRDAFGRRVLIDAASGAIVSGPLDSGYIGSNFTGRFFGATNGLYGTGFYGGGFPASFYGGFPLTTSFVGGRFVGPRFERFDSPGFSRFEFAGGRFREVNVRVPSVAFVGGRFVGHR